MVRHDNYPYSEYYQGSDDNDTHSCKLSGVSKFENSSILSGGVRNKYEAHQRKMKNFVNQQARTQGNNTVANTYLNSLNISKRESIKDGVETFGKQNTPE